MATIAEQLEALKDIQRDLRTAIEAKGVVVGDAPFADYPSLVGAIIPGGFDPAAYIDGDAVTLDGAPVTLGGV